MYRDISHFKNGYQPGTNIVKDDRGDLVTDWHSLRLGGRNFSLSF